VDDKLSLTESQSEWRLDLASSRLLFNGKSIHLTPTCFAVLKYLVQNPKRLITKAELLNNIWSGVYVEEGAIKGYVRKLRQVLDDNPKTPRFIETVRGMGYRYIGNIEVGSSESKLPEVGFSAIAARLSIAILAFNNIGGDPEQEYFSDGITEDIITELARFPVFTVISRHSSFAFKGDKIDIKDVGSKLGVQYIVEGSVRRVGNRVRVTAQLIEVETANHIWAERYDRKLEDIFAVQDDVTSSIVATIAAKLGRVVAENARRKPAANIQSYEFFLQGNRCYYRFNPVDNLKANGYYLKAIERDPRFARAHAGLANTFITDHFLNWHRIENALEKCLESIQAALNLDNNDSLARTIRIWALIANGRWDEAELELDRVLSLKSGDADVLVETGHSLYVVGRLEAGIKLIEEAVQLNPLFPDSYRRWLGIGYYRAKRYHDAAITLRSVELDGWGYGWLAASYARLGEPEKAAEALQDFICQRSKDLDTAGVIADTTAEILGNYRENFRFESDWLDFLGGLSLAGLEN